MREPYGAPHVLIGRSWSMLRSWPIPVYSAALAIFIAHHAWCVIVGEGIRLSKAANHSL